MKRRTYITTILSGAVISGLSGCSAPTNDNDSEDDIEKQQKIRQFSKPEYTVVDREIPLDSFDYPTGFTRHGLSSFERSFGVESMFYDRDSMKIDIRSMVYAVNSQPKLSRTTKYISDSQQRSLWELREPTVNRTDFFNRLRRYQEIEKPGESVSTSKVEGKYEKRQQFLGTIDSYVKGQPIELKGLVTPNVAVYRLASSLENIIETDGVLYDGVVDIVVSSTGMPYAVYIEIHTDFKSEQRIVQFSNFDNVYVGTPNWISTIE